MYSYYANINIQKVYFPLC